MTSENNTVNVDSIRNKYGVSFVFYALATFVVLMSVTSAWAVGALLGIGLLLVGAWMALNGLISLLFVFKPLLPQKLIAYSERSK